MAKEAEFNAGEFAKVIGPIMYGDIKTGDIVEVMGKVPESGYIMIKLLDDSIIEYAKELSLETVTGILPKPESEWKH